MQTFEHDQHTVRKEGIDIEVCNADCRACAISDLRRRIEQLEVQLAACMTAATGWNQNIAKHGDWGWSPVYEGTLRLRQAFERLANGKSPGQVLDAPTVQVKHEP